ncbi:MAG: hypothetical protein K2X27_26680 [Candidatus Obscuribacterales bacterium]|nr:hypothetical protein [Candidatus Obscuribacterales bacterium]
MSKLRLIPLTLTALLASFGLGQAALAQECNLAGAPAFGLRTPYISGSSHGLPFMQAPTDRPPATGDGSCPAPVNPGMGGPPTQIPSVLYTPTNHLGTSNYYLPYNPGTESMPGTLGPSLSVPPPTSTPGCDPGMVQVKNGYMPPVSQTNVNPGGGISGYAPTQKWGGQTTTDYGFYRFRGSRSYDWGQGMIGQTSQDGPYQQLPGAMPTQDLYGRRGYSHAGSTVMTIAPH